MSDRGKPALVANSVVARVASGGPKNASTAPAMGARYPNTTSRALAKSWLLALLPLPAVEPTGFSCTGYEKNKTTQASRTVR